MESECFDDLKKCSHWDAITYLPNGYGRTNNPFFEMAIAQKILFQNGGPTLDFTKFADDCQISGKEPLRHRWPSGSGGNMSHDELIGMAALAIYLARDAVEVLGQFHFCPPFFGFYRNDPNYLLIKTWMNRFPWAIAFLRSRANGYVGGFFQKAWAIHCELVAEYPVSEGTSHILIWLTIDEMEKYDRCKEAAKHWRGRVNMKEVMAGYFHTPGEEWYSKWVKR